MHFKQIITMCVCMFNCSVVSDSFVTPWTVAHEAPLSMRFPRQEHWHELLLPSPGDLPDARIKLTFLMSPPLAGGLFTPRATWEASVYIEKGKERKFAQSCPTLSDPMDCSLPGSSVHGIFQAIILEWVAISFFKASS